MNTRILAMLDRAKVVLGFATTHAVAGASFAAILTRLQGLIATGDALVQQQADGITTQHAALMRRLEVRREMMHKLLERLVFIVDVAAADHPELVDLLPRLQTHASNLQFLPLAKSMLTAAEPHKDLLIATGVGETVFDDLQAAITQYEADTALAHAAETGHVGAVGQLPAIVKQCNREVKIIGNYITSTYAGNAELLAAWKTARKVTPRTKPAAGNTPTPSPAPDTPPAG